jgi:hypothetical protein
LHRKYHAPCSLKAVRVSSSGGPWGGVAGPASAAGPAMATIKTQRHVEIKCWTDKADSIRAKYPNMPPLYQILAKLTTNNSRPGELLHFLLLRPDGHDSMTPTGVAGIEGSFGAACPPCGRGANRDVGAALRTSGDFGVRQSLRRTTWNEGPARWSRQAWDFFS